ncbi:MAG: hypothetical protein H7A21_10675 [Spirochaetales bacterium]|nr:hypothetical protein [Spirochaetales bacterium]
MAFGQVKSSPIRHPPTTFWHPFSGIAGTALTRTGWKQASGVGPSAGDVSFGSGSSACPVTSCAATGSVISSNAGSFAFPGAHDLQYRQRQRLFRIGRGETGGQFEGWYGWHSGNIYVRSFFLQPGDALLVYKT